MKKKLSILTALMLVIIMTVSTALADFNCPLSDFYAGGMLFKVTATIATNKKTAFAKTSGGTGTYDTVNATYYWLDMINDQVGHSSETKSADVEIRSDAISLSGTNKIYYKIISNHYGNYSGSNGSSTNVMTLIY